MEGLIGNSKTYHVVEKAKLKGIDKIHIQFLLTECAINLKKIIQMSKLNELK